MPYTLKSFLNTRTISFGLFRFYKTAYQELFIIPAAEKQILFVLGCQRSGTSLMYWIFERDLNTVIYRESSRLSSNDAPKKLRLNPLPQVRAEINRHKAPLVVLKPLVESQHARVLLEQIPGSKALWMYRHYRDVAASNLKAFGRSNGIKDLRPIVENQHRNWRSENVSDHTRAIIRRYFAEEVEPLDAAALFWFARNRLFFELNLNKQPNVMLCRYEDLVQDPAGVMRQIYDYVDRSYPGDQITKDVHAQSIGKGSAVQLSPGVEAICAGLLADLNEVYSQQSVAVVS